MDIFNENTNNISMMLTQPQVFAKLYDNYVALRTLNKLGIIQNTILLNNIDLGVSHFNSTVSSIFDYLTQTAQTFHKPEKIQNLIENINTFIKESNKILSPKLEKLANFHNTNYGIVIASPITNGTTKIYNSNLTISQEIPFSYRIPGCFQCSDGDRPTCGWRWVRIRKVIKKKIRGKTIKTKIEIYNARRPRKCTHPYQDYTWIPPPTIPVEIKIQLDATVYGTQTWGTCGGLFLFTTQNLNQERFFKNLSTSTMKKLENYHSNVNNLNNDELVNLCREFIKNKELTKDEIDNLNILIKKEINVEKIILTTLNTGFIIPLKYDFLVNDEEFRIRSPKIPLTVPKTNFIRGEYIVLKPNEMIKIHQVIMDSNHAFADNLDMFVRSNLDGLNFVPFNILETQIIINFKEKIQRENNIPLNFKLELFVGHHQSQFPIFFAFKLIIEVRKEYLADKSVNNHTTINQIITKGDKLLDTSIKNEYPRNVHNHILQKLITPFHELLENMIPSLKPLIQKKIEDDIISFTYEWEIPIEMKIEIENNNFNFNF